MLNPFNFIKIIKKYLNKVYDKDIDFYASSLSFLSIFSFIPIILLFFYIFHFSGLFLDILNQVSTMIILFFPDSYSQDIVKVVQKFFDMEGTLNTISLIYIIFTSYLFLKDYKIVLLRIGNNNYNFIESMSLYIKLMIFVPISIVLLSIISFLSQIDIHNFFLMFISILIVYYASIKEAKLLNIAKSSILVSIMLYILKLLFIYYFKYNHIYETLYGSVSFIFFILLWIYVSWIIFLYGVKFIFYQEKNGI